MVSTSKILTVSYGTFSCTLEGFDDSFDTMKAIAEYFRDLAAEDRYFGAEPPVPDAEMLARIAEREIARRVEAREERGSIVLRAAPYGAVAAPLAPLQQTPAPAAAATPPEAASSAAPAIPDPVQVSAPAADNAPDQAQPAAATAAPAPSAPAPEPAPVQATAAPAAAPAAEADDWEDVLAEDQTAPAPAALRPTPVPHPDPDSVAAKLQRIRDVVSKSPTATPQSYSEDEHADSFLSETARSIQSALAAEDQTDLDEDEDDSDEIAALLSRLSQEDAAAQQEDTQPADQETSDAAAVETTDAFVAPPKAEAAPARPVGRIVTIKRRVTATVAATAAQQVEPPAAEQTQAKDSTADKTDDASPLAAQQTSDAKDTPVQADPIVASDLSPEDEEALRQELAAVEAELQSKPMDQDSPTALDVDDNRSTAAAISAVLAQDEQTEDEDDTADQADAVTGQDWSEDDLDDADDLSEDDLAGDNLAAADHKDDDRAEEDDLDSLFAEDDEDDEAALAAETRQSPARDDLRDRLVQSKAEDDMQRLMARAETVRTEPENANRRSAIAHLRAAVAAIKAEKSSGTVPPKTQTTDVFRNDLADVVRPRRPVGDNATATPRPPEQRPAPLKLVAEQRIDLPQAQPDSDPVRPRRVSLAGVPSTPDRTAAPQAGNDLADSGFGEFARKMGAHSLLDLMEAAAAYLAHVEDRNTFSRAQLMTKARQASDGDFNREDGLRAFGQLLRQGKIAKLRGGAFAATEDIGFQPTNRRAG